MENTFYIHYLLLNDTHLLYDVVIAKYKTQLDKFVTYLLNKTFYDVPYEPEDSNVIVYKGLEYSKKYSIEALRKFGFWFLLKQSIFRHLFKLKEHYNTQKQITWNKTYSYDAFDDFSNYVSIQQQHFQDVFMIREFLNYVKQHSNKNNQYIILLLLLLGYTPSEISKQVNKQIKAIYNGIFLIRKLSQEFFDQTKKDS